MIGKRWEQQPTCYHDLRSRDRFCRKHCFLDGEEEEEKTKTMTRSRMRMIEKLEKAEEDENVKKGEDQEKSLHGQG